MHDQKTPQPQKMSVSNLTFRDREGLRLAYMDWALRGGLFVQNPAARLYRLGEPQFLVVVLPDSTERHATSGRIVWLSMGGSRPMGFGVQFDTSPEAERLRTAIEQQLTGLTEGDRPTHTL